MIIFSARLVNGKKAVALELPHSRPLKQGLNEFELRERRYGYRIYYGFYSIKTVVLLAAGYKSTQNNDMKIACQRLSQVSPANIKSYTL